MALTITPRGVDKNATSRAVSSALYFTLTSVTIGVAGDYTPGGTGTPLTPAQLGLGSVLFGIVSVRTVGGAGTAVQGILDCTTPSAPKLKFNTAAAEVAAAGIAGATVDVLAYGLQ